MEREFDLKSKVMKSHLKIVKYPYENPEEGVVGVSDEGEVYVYSNDVWMLVEETEKWEEVYDAEGKNIGRVKGRVFDDYRVGCIIVE